MIDPVSISAAVTLVAPYLAKMGNSAAEKLGEAGAESAEHLLAWMRKKLTGRAREALDDLGVAPESEDNQADLRKQLAKLLEAEPALADEFHALLPDDKVGQTFRMSQRVSGAGAKAQQVSGTGNRTSIS